MAALGLIPLGGFAQDNPFREKPLVASDASKNPFKGRVLDPATVSRLEPFLKNQDWTALQKAVSDSIQSRTIPATLDWLKARTDEGAPFMVPLLYSDLLWTAGNAATLDGLKRQSAFIAIYTVGLIKLDGLACKDTTAPSRRLEQVIGTRLHKPLRAAMDLPAKERAYMVTLAVGLEAVTATQRPREDNLLCRGGLDEMGAAVKSGNVGPARSEPGQIGRIHTVTAPADFRPQFRPEADYLKEQASLRGADLYDYLWGIFGSDGPKK
jgi:hypothetical protein